MTRDKFAELYTILIIAIAIFNLILGIGYIFGETLSTMLLMIVSLIELPLLLVSLMMIIYVPLNRISSSYIILPLVNILIFPMIGFITYYVDFFVGFLLNGFLYIIYLIIGFAVLGSSTEHRHRRRHISY